MRRTPATPYLTAAVLAMALLASGCASAPSLPSAGPGVAAGAPVVQKISATGTVAGLKAGSLVLNPVSGRPETVTPDIARTALLIGDSQSEGAAGVGTKETWTHRALAQLGYNVHFCGRGGTGFVAANPPVGNYVDALEHGNWYVPYGKPPLVIIEGGGNDATRGATDAQISANAERLIDDLKASYPTSLFVLVGTLAKGAANGGGRRTAVDALLGTVAAHRGIPFISAGDWVTRYGLGNKLADGVHLTAAGHHILADVLAARLKDLGVGAPVDGTTAVVAKVAATKGGTSN